MKNIPKAMIKAMSYANRQRNFDQEKSELVQKMKDATAIERQDALKALVKKWGV